MKTFLKSLMPLTLCGLALVACGKKDDNTQKNTLGARARDAQTSAAEAAANQMGVSGFDFSKINKIPSEYSTAVEFVLTVNGGQSTTVYTDHFNPNYGGTNMVSGSTTLGSYRVDVTAQCSDAVCNQYVVLASLINPSNYTRIIQQCMKYDFTSPSNSSYVKRDASAWMDFNACNAGVNSYGYM